MQRPQEARPRARSPFAAAFLSLIFPGLGQLYAGAPMRALAFAAPPILLLALGGGVALRMSRNDLIGLVFDVLFLQSVLVVNIVVLVYRLVAIVDAYRVAEFLNAHDAGGTGRLGPARIGRHPLSIAGLLAVVLVMSGAHVVVARYDMLALDALTSGCIFVGADQNAVCTDNGDSGDSADASGTPGATETPAGTDTAQPTGTPTAEPTPIGTQVPEVSIPPWNGKDRLNILLIGADVQGGGHNTDTLITVSIDPVSKQVVMFSLPRDMTNVPLPSGPARSFWGSTYGQKINSLYVNNRNRGDLWPGKASLRGYNALKSTIGYLYGLDINYFVEVNFDGFRQVINTLGGVTVNVQVPISDDTYPATGGANRRLYIPSGLQHMNGLAALRYARSRHSTNDFDRSARQQRLLISLRQQADPQQLIPRLPELVSALKGAVKTDIPVSQFDELLGLASQIDTNNISSYVFQPPLYGSETAPGAPVYKMFPNVQRIRNAVKTAFKRSPVDEAQAEALADEGAQIWVLNPLADKTRGPSLASYLEYKGLNASSPRQQPTSTPATTKIVVYNGAEANMETTIAFLEKQFKTKVETVTDPAIRADIIITIGRDTPDLEAPPIS